MSPYTDAQGKVWNICSATEIHNMFVSLFSNTSPVGIVDFTLAGHCVKAKTRDIIGNLVENWVRDYLSSIGVYGRPNPNTQTPPDIYLLPDDNVHGCLEVKAFYNDANFDIADFKPFAADLFNNIWQLDEDFLIFQYDMDETSGDVTIVNVYLKKMWQICGYCEDRSIKLQAKNGQINKIRPVAWFSENAQYKPFATVEDFLAAVKALYNDVEDDLAKRTSWSRKVERAYREFFGHAITIPDYHSLSEEDRSYSAEKKYYQERLKAEKSVLRDLKKQLAEAVKEKSKTQKQYDKMVTRGVSHDTPEFISIEAALAEKNDSLRQASQSFDEQTTVVSNFKEMFESVDATRKACAERLVY